ncbi:HAD-IC family P-type ATPase [Microbacterium lacticum]
MTPTPAPPAWAHRTTDATAEQLAAVDAWWRAANYLSIGQIYLQGNPLLRHRLSRDDIKPRLLGHWGTTPGLNFLYAHLNRAIRDRDLNTLYVTGPGHGGPGMVANAYLDGTYTERYPGIDRTEEGLRALFRQFSFPGGIPSHASPETPGSINEGGELGYSLVHAYGAAFDNPDLLVACVIGDGEAETGPLATAWHGNKFLNPAHDGVVLPILHLNGYKIANPTVLSRIPEEELVALLRGYGHHPHVVTVGFDGETPQESHATFAAVLDAVLDEIADIKAAAAAGTLEGRPAWPAIVLRSPKGWTCPKIIDGLPVEGTWRAHQVPLAEVRDNPEHLRILEDWLASYRDIPRRTATAFRNVTGEGAIATVDGRQVVLGNPRLLTGEGIDISGVQAAQQDLAGSGRTAILFAVDGQVAGIIGLADAPRDTAKTAIDALHEQGVEVAMLTGDNKPTADRIAALLGMDTVIADVLPEDKSAKVAELQKTGKKVAMVGDGVNDAPALAQADLGIAIGAGTDVAIETADVVLMRSDPLDVAIALKIGKGTLRKMRQNLGWAIGYNAAALPIAAGVFYPAFGIMLSPEIAALSMSGSSVIVAVNALLLKRLRLPAQAPAATTMQKEPEHA